MNATERAMSLVRAIWHVAGWRHLILEMKAQAERERQCGQK
jgi:hypothetical protein